MTGRTGAGHIPFAFLRPPPKALNTAALIRPSMTWGLQNRLGRIIQPVGHAVMLAVDHGYFMGPTSRLEDPRKTIHPPPHRPPRLRGDEHPERRPVEGEGDDVRPRGPPAQRVGARDVHLHRLPA